MATRCCTCDSVVTNAPPGARGFRCDRCGALCPNPYYDPVAMPKYNAAPMVAAQRPQGQAGPAAARIRAAAQKTFNNSNNDTRMAFNVNDTRALARDQFGKSLLYPGDASDMLQGSAFYNEELANLMEAYQLAQGAAPAGVAGGPGGGGAAAWALPVAGAPGGGAAGAMPLNIPATYRLRLLDVARRKHNSGIRKDLLGEALFPLVVTRAGPALAPKITGLLLAMDLGDILALFEDPTGVELHQRIQESLNVLNAAAMGVAGAPGGGAAGALPAGHAAGAPGGGAAGALPAGRTAGAPGGGAAGPGGGAGAAADAADAAAARADAAVARAVSLGHGALADRAARAAFVARNAAAAARAALPGAAAAVAATTAAHWVTETNAAAAALEAKLARQGGGLKKKTSRKNKKRSKSTKKFKRKN